jgi:hypothetical protein
VNLSNIPVVSFVLNRHQTARKGGFCFRISYV